MEELFLLLLPFLLLLLRSVKTSKSYWMLTDDSLQKQENMKKEEWEKIYTNGTDIFSSSSSEAQRKGRKGGVS